MIKRLKYYLKYLQRFLKSIYYLLSFLIFEIKKIKNSEIVFIIPYYQTGGAERIHLNILKAVSHKEICVLFTHNSSTNNFYNDFDAIADIIELNKILTKKISFINEYLKKVIAKSINKNKKLISVFGSNTNFYYKLLPYIKLRVKKIDLIHAISGENKPLVDLYMLNSSHLDLRIVINKKAKSDLLNLYKLNDIGLSYHKKIVVVQNAVEMSNVAFNKIHRNKIKIGFIGRWSPEKRPEIFLKIAKEIKKIKPEVEFVMAGIGMKSNIGKINEANVKFLGEITDNKTLQKLYNSLTFILTTSYREGFPVVIMEAMSHGVIPISTDVGGINEHIKNGINGILISNGDENKIIIDFVNAIKDLLNDKEKKLSISKYAYQYSHLNFQLKEFNKKYQEILLNNK